MNRPNGIRRAIKLSLSMGATRSGRVFPTESTADAIEDEASFIARQSNARRESPKGQIPKGLSETASHEIFILRRAFIFPLLLSSEGNIRL